MPGPAGGGGDGAVPIGVPAQLGMGRSRSFRKYTTRMEAAAGRIRVRCMGASNLPVSEERLFQWKASTSYAVLRLQSADGEEVLHSREKRTQPKPGSNPQWREDFWFTLRKRPQELPQLSLHVGVWKFNSWKVEPELLGTATLEPEVLKAALQLRQVQELELTTSAASMRVLKKQGSTLKLEICWEPSSMMSGDFARREAFVLLRSPQVMRVFRVGLLGSAAGLFTVAASSRWLCRGTSFATCREENVPGAATCAVIAAVAVSISTLINFMGSAGFLGSSWSGEPLSVLDLIGSEAEEEPEGNMGGGDPTIRMQVQSVGLTAWNVSLSTSFLPSLGDALIAIRLLTMFCHLSASALSLLALALAYLEDSEGDFLGEACYLSAGAFVCLATSAATSWRERRLLAEADNEKWCAASPATASPKAHTWGLGDAGNPLNRFITADGLALPSNPWFTPGDLTQPLLDAQQRLAEAFQNGRPVADPKELFQTFLAAAGARGGASPAGAGTPGDVMSPTTAGTADTRPQTSSFSGNRGSGQAGTPLTRSGIGFRQDSAGPTRESPCDDAQVPDPEMDGSPVNSPYGCCRC